MITPKFYLRMRKGDAGTIYVNFYINREKVHFSTRVNCLIKNWDERRACVKNSDVDAKDKNIVLESIRARVTNVFVKFRLKDRKLTRDLFLKHYNRPSDYDTFFDFCRAFQKSGKEKLELNTIRMHNSVLKKLEAYNPKLHFDDIDSLFLKSYKHHLIHVLNNNLNTTTKNLAVIRKYVRIACRGGYMELNPFDEVSLSKEKSDIVFLDDDELMKLCNFYYSGNYKPKHKSTLQLFLFMCFGSQHVGDAKKMRIEQFGENSFVYFRIKNRNSRPIKVEVPISKPLRRLVDEVSAGREKGLLFRQLPADQTMNRYLKDIATEVGIEKEIKNKSGRHTFATIYLENNPNIRTLQDILGHSEMKTTMVYVHAMEKYKNEGIKCFDKFL